MILSNQLGYEKLVVPTNLNDLKTYEILPELGMVSFPYSGVPLFLPIGYSILKNISTIIEKHLQYHGFSQIYAPLIQHKSYLQSSERLAAVEKELFYLQDRYSDFFLSPTNEEFFLSILDGNLSYRNLPVRFFQIADKFRNIKKPKGILRSKQFLMCDAVSIDASPASLSESKYLFEQAAINIFKELCIDYIRCEKDEGNYVDFLVLCPEGETSLNKNHDGTFDFAKCKTDYTASSIGMYFIYTYQNSLTTKFTDNSGKRQSVLMGTYGFGMQRCMHAVVHQYRDHLGVNIPASIRPFDISVFPVDTSSEMQCDKTRKIYDVLRQHNLRLLLDDRSTLTFKQRAAYSDAIGVPYKIVIGKRELENNQLTVKFRDSLQEHTIQEHEAIPYFNSLSK